MPCVLQSAKRRGADFKITKGVKGPVPEGATTQAEDELPVSTTTADKTKADTAAGADQAKQAGQQGADSAKQAGKEGAEKAKAGLNEGLDKVSKLNFSLSCRAAYLRNN